jgi:hypothetical protein
MEFNEQMAMRLTIAIFYILSAVILHALLFRFIKRSSQNSLASMLKADALQEEILHKAKDTEKLEILKYQFSVASEIKTYYRDLAVSYYQNYFVFTICSVVYTIITGVLVFVITATGWEHASYERKFLFLFTISLASFYYFLPNVLNNKVNLQKNMGGVKIFQGIQMDLLAYVDNPKPEPDTDAFIANVYKSMQNNYDYNITLDTSLLNKDPINNFKGIIGK